MTVVRHDGRVPFRFDSLKLGALCGLQGTGTVQGARMALVHDYLSMCKAACTACLLLMDADSYNGKSGFKWTKARDHSKPGNRIKKGVYFET